MTKILTFTSLALALALVVAANVEAQEDSSNWSRFRGPSGSGVVEALEFPASWSQDKNVAWSVDLQGGGLSSPIIVGEQVIVTSAVGFAPPVSFSEGVRDMRPKLPEGKLEFKVTSFNLTNGEKVWEKTVAKTKPQHPIHGSNSFATESPATDGETLFVYYAAIGEVAALDLQGKEIWKKNIGAFRTGNGFGTGSSITVGDGNVFIQCDNDEKSFVVALSAESGEEVWRKDRTGRTSWASPLIWKNETRNELITCGSGFVTSYDPSNGDILWNLSGVGMSFSSSPAVDEKRLYFGNSGPRSSGPLVSISAGMQGENAFAKDAQLKGLAWSKMQAGPGMSSPVSVGGYLFVSQRGRLVIYKSDSGEIANRQRLDLGTVAASMWAAGDRVFIMDEDGKTVVLKVGGEFEVVETNSIEGDLFWSTPSVSGKSLLIRGVKKLYCIRAAE